MADNKGTVKTDVDSLIKLVKQKKEISFDEASKILSVPVSTVESWGNFLEEEGELSINYKFTTPYLVANEEEKFFDKKVVDKVSNNLSEFDNLFNFSEEYLSKEDYSSAHKNILNIQTKMENLFISVKKDKHLSQEVNLNLFLERLDVFKKIINHTSSLKQKGDLTRLKSAYDQIIEDFKDMYENVKNSFDKINQDKVKELNNELSKEIETDDEIPEESEEIKKEIDVEIKTINDYERLLKEVDIALKNNDYDLVKKIYSNLELFYKELPKKFAENKTNLQKSILELNKKLTNELGIESLKKVEEKSNQIHSLAKILKNNIKEKKLDEAEKNYNEIQKIFLELPDGFLDVKITLENLIVELHLELINAEKEDFIHELQEDKIKIDNLISKINNSLDNEKISEAYDFYNEIIKIFETLPKGFLKEKIEFQKIISNIYEKILVTEKEIKENDFKDKLTKINIIFEEIEHYIQNKDIEQFSYKLTEVNNIFDSLPEGFFEEKAEIENMILEFSKKYFNLEKEHLSNKFDEINKKIEQLFLALNSYLYKNDYDLAREVYKEIVHTYNLLPKGFSKKKSEIRSQIFEIYQRIMLNDGINKDEDLSKSVKEKYDEILHLIVQIHKDIGDRLFDSMINKYQKLISIYNELPIGFIKDHSNVKFEILKLYDLVNLYSETEKLENKLKSNNIDDIKKSFKKISKLYNELYHECKEDIELFSYVKEKYNYFYQSLIHNNEESEVIESNEEDISKNLDFDINEESLNYETNKNFNFEDQINEEKNIDFDLNILDKNEGLLNDLLIKAKNNNYNKNYDYLNNIINSIKSNDIIIEKELDSFFSFLNHLNKINSIDSRLALTKLLRSINELINNNVSSSYEDIKKLKKLFPNNPDLLNLYYYISKLNSEKN